MKRTEILAMALKCFSIHGYFGCSMQQIADSVGINKATLYHYYQSKQELYLAVFDIQMENYLNIFKELPDSLPGESPRSVLFQISHTMVSSRTIDEIMFIKGTHNMLASDMEKPFMLALRERLSACNRDIANALSNFHPFGLDIQNDLGTTFLASYFIFINGFLDWMLINAHVSNQDVSDKLDILFDVFWEGCNTLLPVTS